MQQQKIANKQQDYISALLLTSCTISSLINLFLSFAMLTWMQDQIKTSQEEKRSHPNIFLLMVPAQLQQGKHQEAAPAQHKITEGRMTNWSTTHVKVLCTIKGLSTDQVAHDSQAPS